MTNLCRTLLARMNGLDVVTSDDLGVASDLSSGILVLAGSEVLAPAARARHQATLTTSVLPSAMAPATGEEGVGGGQGLPQTDLTQGLLASLSSSSTPTLQAMVAATRPAPQLLALLAKLPQLSALVKGWEGVMGSSPAPSSLSLPVLPPDLLPSLAAELRLASRLLTLPVFAPLALDQVSRVTSLAMAGLMGVLATINTNDNADMVTDCLSMLDTVAGLVKTSTRLGAAASMNLTMVTSWVLVQGLLSPPPSATTTTMTTGLALLTERLVTCLSSLLADLSPEEVGGGGQAVVSLKGEYTGEERCKLVLAPDLLPLLLHLASLAFNQARAGLVGEQEVPPLPLLAPPREEGEEEPLLGAWMTAILAPEPLTAPFNIQGSVGEAGEADVHGDMEGTSTSCLALSTSLLTFLSSSISSNCPFLRPFALSSITTQFITTLASLTTSASTAPLPTSLPAWPRFSLALSSLTNALVASPIPFALPSLLLEKLLLSPTSLAPWHLAAPRRCLAVLAQVLLTRQAGEEAHSTTITTQYVTIWERVVTAMATAATSAKPQDDATVTLLHLLLLLFHSLQLMQKKSVLVAVTRALAETCKAAPRDPPPHFCLHLARLALLEDYLVRHLYEPPSSLLPLIRANLFSLSSLCSAPSSPITPELDDPGTSPNPYFLLLAPPPGLQGPEVPRLDGLALSFLLSTPDQVNYPGLHASLLTALHPLTTSSAGPSALYCFLSVWRLVQALPPPAPLLRHLVTVSSTATEDVVMEYGTILSTLSMAPKAGHRNYSAWLRDSLTKQGVGAPEAEALVTAVATRVNSCSTEVTPSTLSQHK